MAAAILHRSTRALAALHACGGALITASCRTLPPLGRWNPVRTRQVVVSVPCSQMSDKVKGYRFEEKDKYLSLKGWFFYLRILIFSHCLSTKFPAFPGNLSKPSRSQKYVLAASECEPQSHRSCLAWLLAQHFGLD